jgi:hypothetical protein
MEQYQRGRSCGWYWRQVLTAIFFGAANDILDHKLLAVRAIAAGWASIVAFNFVAGWALYTLRVLSSGGIYVAEYWIRLPDSFSHWMWQFRPGLLLLLATTASTFSGWMVGRFHRDRQRSMTFGYLASVLVIAPFQSYELVSGSATVVFGRWVAIQTLGPWYVGTGWRFIGACTALTWVWTIGILVGGLWSVTSDRDSLNRHARSGQR